MADDTLRIKPKVNGTAESMVGKAENEEAKKAENKPAEIQVGQELAKPTAPASDNKPQIILTAAEEMALADIDQMAFGEQMNNSYYQHVFKRASLDEYNSKSKMPLLSLFDTISQTTDSSLHSFPLLNGAGLTDRVQYPSLLIPPDLSPLNPLQTDVIPLDTLQKPQLFVFKRKSAENPESFDVVFVNPDGKSYGGFKTLTFTTDPIKLYSDKSGNTVLVHKHDIPNCGTMKIGNFEICTPQERISPTNNFTPYMYRDNQGKQTENSSAGDFLVGKYITLTPNSTPVGVNTILFPGYEMTTTVQGLMRLRELYQLTQDTSDLLGRVKPSVEEFLSHNPSDPEKILFRMNQMTKDPSAIKRIEELPEIKNLLTNGRLLRSPYHKLGNYEDVVSKVYQLPQEFVDKIKNIPEMKALVTDLELLKSPGFENVIGKLSQLPKEFIEKIKDIPQIRKLISDKNLLLSPDFENVISKLIIIAKYTDVFEKAKDIPGLGALLSNVDFLNSKDFDKTILRLNQLPEDLIDKIKDVPEIRELFIRDIKGRVISKHRGFVAHGMVPGMREQFENLFINSFGFENVISKLKQMPKGLFNEIKDIPEIRRLLVNQNLLESPNFEKIILTLNNLNKKFPNIKRLLNDQSFVNSPDFDNVIIILSQLPEEFIKILGNYPDVNIPNILSQLSKYGFLTVLGFASGMSQDANSRLDEIGNNMVATVKGVNYLKQDIIELFGGTSLDDVSEAWKKDQNKLLKLTELSNISDFNSLIEFISKYKAVTGKDFNVENIRKLHETREKYCYASIAKLYKDSADELEKYPGRRLNGFRYPSPLEKALLKRFNNNEKLCQKWLDTKRRIIHQAVMQGAIIEEYKGLVQAFINESNDFYSKCNINYDDITREYKSAVRNVFGNSLTEEKLNKIIENQATYDMIKNSVFLIGVCMLTGGSALAVAAISAEIAALEKYADADGLTHDDIVDITKDTALTYASFKLFSAVANKVNTKTYNLLCKHLNISPAKAAFIAGKAGAAAAGFTTSSAMRFGQGVSSGEDVSSILKETFKSGLWGAGSAVAFSFLGDAFGKIKTKINELKYARLSPREKVIYDYVKLLETLPHTQKDNPEFQKLMNSIKGKEMTPDSAQQVWNFLEKHFEGSYFATNNVYKRVMKNVTSNNGQEVATLDDIQSGKFHVEYALTYKYSSIDCTDGTLMSIGEQATLGASLKFRNSLMRWYSSLQPAPPQANPAGSKPTPQPTPTPTPTPTPQPTQVTVPPAQAPASTPAPANPVNPANIAPSPLAPASVVMTTGLNPAQPAQPAVQTTQPATQPQTTGVQTAQTTQPAVAKTGTPEISKPEIERTQENTAINTRLTLSDDILLEIAKGITTDVAEQQLIINMLKNEVIHITPEREQAIMKKQYNDFLQANPNVNMDNIYIYSPRPNGQIKSYSRSGKIFSEANNIPDDRIKTSLADIPKGAIVFVVDDCSITGASMILDTLEGIANFEGRIVFAPTVMGSGSYGGGFNSQSSLMANDILNMLSKINNADEIALKNIITAIKQNVSDGKSKNEALLDRLNNCAGRISFECVQGSVLAPNFRETETFKKLPIQSQRKIDAIFTRSGLCSGYHKTGTMVLMADRTPNNNVGIMTLLGKELGLAAKPTAILDYGNLVAIDQKGMQPLQGFMYKLNNNGNPSGMFIETIGGTGPAEFKTAKALNIRIQLPDGTQTVIRNYKPVVGSPEVASKEFCFDVEPEFSDKIYFTKGSYTPRTAKKGALHSYADVLIAPKGSKVIDVEYID